MTSPKNLDSHIPTHSIGLELVNDIRHSHVVSELTDDIVAMGGLVYTVSCRIEQKTRAKGAHDD
jgi:hypothetical protein